MILCSHPTGNPYVRQSVRALAEANLLAEFWTGIHWNPDTRTAQLLPSRLRKQMERRTFPVEARTKTRSHAWREIGRLTASRLRLMALTRHEVGPLSVDAVFHDLDRCVARRIKQFPGLCGVYAGEDGALETFRAAEQLGLSRFYDLPIGYWRAAQALYREEADYKPAWAATLEGRADSAAKLARKDEELARANVVFVASSFTRQTLTFAPDRPRHVELVSYGAPPVTENALCVREKGPLRVLFVGSLSQRKGLSYLFDAIKTVGSHATLTVIGMRPDVDCATLDDALRSHRWIASLPHATILEEMRAHDVLVFPSLFEGFGLVILEAMSQGLPVIATPNTAGPDVLTHGKDGFIVPIRSAEAIAQILETLHTDKDYLQALKEAARETAAQHTWEAYRTCIVKTVQQQLTERGAVHV